MRSFFRTVALSGKGRPTASSGQDIVGGTVGAGTVLQSSGLATTLNFAVKPGIVNAGNVVDLVSSANKALTKSAGAAVGSDADGRYMNVPTSADWCEKT